MIDLKHKTLYLFRHALATHSQTGYGDQILTADILPEGIPPVQRLAKHLHQYPVTAAYVSRVKRCQQTAELVSQVTGLEFESDARLNELYSESFDDFLQRVSSFLQDLALVPDSHIAICTHGAVIGAVKSILVDKQQATFAQIDDSQSYPLTGVLWIINNSKLEAINFN